MVGMLGLGSRHPPSADIRCSDASGPIASPRLPPSSADQTLPADSRDNTSSGGLHFFSLPHWTRRILPVSSSARKSLAGSLHADERSADLRNMRGLLLEKDLPPTPSPQTDADTASHEPSAQLNDTRVSITPPQPTFYLDVYHNTPMISPSSQMNSVTFASFPNSSVENVLRKSKSTHSLRPEQPSSNEQKRTRGVSMTQMFLTAKRASASPTGGNSPSTPLVRKSSFWSRKFSASSPQHLAVPPESPLLPVVKPTSPLQVDFTAHPDSLARSRSNSSGARLSRHHSERAVRHPSKTRANIPSLPQCPAFPDRNDVRPLATNPQFLTSHRSLPRRPTTADSATPLRSRSLFALSQQSSPPSDHESFVAKATSRSKISPTNPRPRSSTNPPLLHRLSVNLFSSPSPATLFFNGLAASPTSRSPRPSLSQIPPDVLKPRASESSETFVDRMVSLVSKAEILGVLASA